MLGVGVRWRRAGAGHGAGCARHAVTQRRRLLGAFQHAGFELRVAPGVFVEVVTTHETFVTDRANKPLLPCNRVK